MAKKAKKSILASVMSPAEEIAAGDIVSEATQNAESIEVKEEIKYDDICDKSEELARLSKENSDLTDKLASYIEEIESLKAETKKWKDEYDNHLVKISELTFENATLKAQIDEMSKGKNLEVNENGVRKPIQVRQSTNVPYIHQVNCNKNGYSDWN